MRCTRRRRCRAPEDVDRAYAAADAAFETWGETTPQEPRERAARASPTPSRSGSRRSTRSSATTPASRSALTMSEEMPYASDHFRFFAGAARVLEGRSAGEYMADHTSWVRREPIGVVGQVTPWNYPLMMMIWKIAPALAGGNTDRAQAERHDPGQLDAAGRALPGVPAARRPQRRLRRPRHRPSRWSSTRHRRWWRSPARSGPGMEVAGSAAKDLKRVHLELGGKAPVIVFDDADVEKAAEGIAMAGYFNAGQDCTAATRVLAGPRRPRRLRRGAHRAGEEHQDRAARRRGRPLRRPQQREPARAGGRHGRPASRPRDRLRRRPSAGRASATSTSRPCSRASSRTTSRSRTRSSAR